MNVRSSVALDGSALVWEIFPAAPPVKPNHVLLVPGLTSRNHPKYAPVYTDLAELLAKNGNETVTLALRGQLGSEGVFSFPNAVDDLEAILVDWLSSAGGGVSIFARSSGAPIALRLARRVPDCICRLFLWGCSPRGVYDRLFGPKSDGEYLRACVEYGTKFAEDFEVTLFYPEDELPYVNCPVWLGLGTDDEYTGPEEQAAILRRAKDRRAILVVVPYCPHALASDHPAWPTYSDLIQAWLHCC